MEWTHKSCDKYRLDLSVPHHLDPPCSLDSDAGDVLHLFIYFSCLCSWRMAVRQPKVASPSETWFCPLTASPRRAWTTWRPRTRSRVAPATSASPCRSKPPHRAEPCPHACFTPYWFQWETGRHLSSCQRSDRDAHFHTRSHDPVDLKTL